MIYEVHITLTDISLINSTLDQALLCPIKYSSYECQYSHCLISVWCPRLRLLDFAIWFRSLEDGSGYSQPVSVPQHMYIAPSSSLPPPSAPGPAG